MDAPVKIDMAARRWDAPAVIDKAARRWDAPAEMRMAARQWDAPAKIKYHGAAIGCAGRLKRWWQGDGIRQPNKRMSLFN